MGFEPLSIDYESDVQTLHPFVFIFIGIIPTKQFNSIQKPYLKMVTQ